MSKEKYVKCLNAVKNIFDAHNIIYWLDYGTLWGAIRDGKIMEFDNDFDFGVFLRDVPKISQLKQEFATYGYELRVNKNHLNYVIHDFETGEHLGCILFRKAVKNYMIRIKFNPLTKWLRLLNIFNGGFGTKLAWKVVIGLHLYRDMEVSSKVEDLGTLKEINFYGKQYPIPVNPEKYLDFMYPYRDWRIVAKKPLHGSEIGRRRERLREVLNERINC